MQIDKEYFLRSGAYLPCGAYCNQLLLCNNNDLIICSVSETGKIA